MSPNGMTNRIWNWLRGRRRSNVSGPLGLVEHYPQTAPVLTRVNGQLRSMTPSREVLRTSVAELPNQGGTNARTISGHDVPVRIPQTQPDEMPVHLLPLSVVRTSVGGGGLYQGGVPVRMRKNQSDEPYFPGRIADAFTVLAGLKRLPTLLWAMPCYGNIHPKVYRSHLSVVGSLAKLGVRVLPQYVIVTNKTNLAAASNKIVSSALSLGVDYLMWTEMDMDLPDDCVSRLMDRGKEVCSGLYFLRGTEKAPQPCAYLKYQGNDAKTYSFVPIAVLPPETLVRVDACGMGCVLIRTDALRDPVFHVKPPEGTPNGEPPGSLWFDDRERECGQDMFFYTKLWQAGIEVWLDTSVVCTQYDEDRPASIGAVEWNAFVKEGKVSGGFIMDKDHADKHAEVRV